MTKRGLVLALAFTAGGAVFLGLAMRPRGDLRAECKEQCGFRDHRLAPDPAWGKNKSGEPARYKCECY